MPTRRFIRASLYGGRVQNCIPFFECNMFEEKVLKWSPPSWYDDCNYLKARFNFKKPTQSFPHLTSCGVIFHNKTLTAIDMNSLYPTAMVNFEVHLGDVVNLTKNELTNFRRTEGNLYIIRFGKVLYRGPKTSFYLMGERKDDKLSYSPDSKKCLILNSIDYLELEKYGYRFINPLEGVKVLGGTNSLQDTIFGLYESRKQSESVEMKTMYKLMMNSVYGKFCTKEIDYEWKLYDEDEIADEYADEIISEDYLPRGHLIKKRTEP